MTLLVAGSVAGHQTAACVCVLANSCHKRLPGAGTCSDAQWLQESGGVNMVVRGYACMQVVSRCLPVSNGGGACSYETVPHACIQSAFELTYAGYCCEPSKRQLSGQRFCQPRHAGRVGSFRGGISTILLIDATVASSLSGLVW